MVIYSDNMITCKRTSNVYSDPKEWLHLSMVRNYIKIKKIKINNDDSETTQLFLEGGNDDL